MVWYNPLDWLRRELPEADIRCNNPSCLKSIEAGAIYIPEERMIYHDRCVLDGLANLVYSTRRVTTGNFKRISRRRALKLYHKGLVVQDGQATGDF